MLKNSDLFAITFDVFNVVSLETSVKFESPNTTFSKNTMETTTAKNAHAVSESDATINFSSSAATTTATTATTPLNNSCRKQNYPKDVCF